MHVVITGGAGFIGANLARHFRLLRVAHRVTVVDDLSSGSRSNLDGLDVRLVEGSVLDADVLDEAFSGADAVVHLAAVVSVPQSLEEPLATHVANTTGTLQVLEAARRAGGLHTTVASSAALYGADPTMPQSEELPSRPVNPYGASKLAAEAYALAWASSFALPTLALRFFNVFGPLQPAGHAYASVIPAFVDAAVRGRPVTVHGDGRQTRDFVFVDDVAAVLVDAVARRVTSHGPVNLASGSRLSLLDVLDALEGILGFTVPRIHTDARPGDVRHSRADQTRLQALFPSLEPTPFNEGLARTVAWFRT